jgi:hypothetical protein
MAAITALSGNPLSQAYARKYPRVSVRIPVECTVGEKSSRCRAITLSGGGLFLIEAPELELGKELRVRFRPAKHLPVIEAKALVRYLVPGQGTAIEFTEIKPEDRLRLLRLIHQKTGDKRLNPRAPLATQVECEGCSTLAFSRDVSMGGMFIEMTMPFPVGKRVRVLFHLSDKDTVIKVGALVAYHVEKMGVGIIFEEISPEDLLAIKDYVLRVSTPRRNKTETNAAAP